MASFTAILKRKRARRHAQAGHARKVVQGQHSTLSYDALFAGMGEPGQPAPSGSSPSQGNDESKG